MAQKGLKMHEKKQKIEFLDLKYLLFSGIFLSGILNAFLSISNREMKNESGFSLAIASQPFRLFIILPSS